MQARNCILCESLNWVVVEQARERQRCAGSKLYPTDPLSKQGLYKPTITYVLEKDESTTKMVKYADNPEAVNLIRDQMIFGKLDSLCP